MPFDYEANTAAVRSALLGYNTTTSSPDLSSGLTTRIANVFIDDPEVRSIKWDELPAVFVRVQNADEEAAGLGATGPANVRKFKDVRYELIGMYVRDGAGGSNATHMTEVYRLAENLEGVFQAEYKLSTTALYCHPESTNFGSFSFGDVRVRGFVTTLKARYLFR